MYYYVTPGVKIALHCEALYQLNSACLPKRMLFLISKTPQLTIQLMLAVFCSMNANAQCAYPIMVAIDAYAAQWYSFNDVQSIPYQWLLRPGLFVSTTFILSRTLGHSDQISSL